MKNNGTQYPGRAARQSEILMEIIEHAENAVQNQEAVDNTLSEIFRKNRKFGSKDRRLYSDAVFAWFRWYGWTQSIRDTNPEKALILSWLLSYKDIPDSIAYLIDKNNDDSTQVHTLWDQPLNKRAACLASWGRLSQTSHTHDLAPAWLESCLKVPNDTPASKFTDQFIESLLSRPPTWLSAPISLEAQLPEKLTRTGLAHTIHPYLKTAFYLEKPFALSELCKKVGMDIIIQDLASQCVGMMCKPGSGENWWDTCAGAGGKSLHLAQLMNNQGSILASDIRSNSLRQIHRRAREAHISIIKMKQLDIIDESTELDSMFDGVLIDAPCSGIGTWGRNPDMRWRTTANNPKEKSKLQRQILEKASQRVKQSGTLVYAVCTNTGIETTDIIEPFLETHPNFKLDPVPHPLTGEPTDGQVYIWPWDGPCNGMYVARMKKSEDSSQ